MRFIKVDLDVLTTSRQPSLEHMWSSNFMDVRIRRIETESDGLFFSVTTYDRGKVSLPSPIIVVNDPSAAMVMALSLVTKFRKLKEKAPFEEVVEAHQSVCLDNGWNKSDAAYFMMGADTPEYMKILNLSIGNKSHGNV